MDVFGAKSALQLDAHCHLHWSLPNLGVPQVALRTTSDKPSQQLPSLSLLYESKEGKTDGTIASFCHPERNERASVSEVEGPPEDAHDQICPYSSTGKPLSDDALTEGGTFRRSLRLVFLRDAQKNSAQDDVGAQSPSLIPNPSDAISVFINTVTPQEYETVAGIECDNINVGLGFHPWYVEQCDIDLFEELLPTTQFIGEIGLDFSKRFTQEQKEHQINCFKKICECLATRSFAAQSAPRDDVGGQSPSLFPNPYSLIPILSVHTFNTHGKTHEILKETGVLDNCIVIYHWFGDGPSELKRAINDNCLFSVNERMLSSKRGAELAKMIPEEQLLFETDMPKAKGDFWSIEDSRESIIFAWQKWTKMVNATSK